MQIEPAMPAMRYIAGFLARTRAEKLLTNKLTALADIECFRGWLAALV